VTVAALYVETDGAYANLAGIDPWDEARDARLYTGPHPVVAHPPCQRWGRYSENHPITGKIAETGDDGGCFEHSVNTVRRVGGVIEHPADSKGWAKFGLRKPKRGAGWTEPDEFGGRSCYVEQGHYGHFARKGTWLYAVLPVYPELIWGPCEQRIHARALELHGYEKARRIGMMAMVGGKDKTRIRNASPGAFRDLLISMAETVRPTRAAA
jgi:hypothetical protein